MNEKSVKIIVASHKPYRMPEDPLYLPLQVGAEVNDVRTEFTRDNTGDNISDKNPSYCELTGLYWAWKTLDADYLGLAHYRRHFRSLAAGGAKDPFAKILTGEEARNYLESADIIVPVRRRYYIETLYSHYAHTHYAGQLDLTREIISEKYPSYLHSYDRAVHRTSGYMFNMMIMRRDLFNSYCAWLFDILGELEKRVDASGLDAFQARFYGRISEIIFNVWLDRKIASGKISRSRIREIPVIYTEPIDWVRKGRSFLQAKFLHRKYESSF